YSQFVAETVQIGNYTVQSSIGEGGMGIVYHAIQTGLNRPVALKILRPNVIGDQTNLFRFQREMRIASRLNHPNLVRVLDAGAADGVLYIAMELVDGEPLDRILREHQRLRWPLALAICTRVAEALAYIHDRQILHRDLKPGNIMLSATSGVKVLD